MNNGPLHTKCIVLRNVVLSDAESKLGALFHNIQTTILLHTILKELLYKQSPTPIETEKSNPLDIVKSTVKKKKLKSIFMRFYWVKDRTHQGQFFIDWGPGKTNKLYYFTKHHPQSHRTSTRHEYLHKVNPSPIFVPLR